MIYIQFFLPLTLPTTPKIVIEPEATASISGSPLVAAQTGRKHQSLAVKIPETLAETITPSLATAREFTVVLVKELNFRSISSILALVKTSLLEHLAVEKLTADDKSAGQPAKISTVKILPGAIFVLRLAEYLWNRSLLFFF